MQFYLFLNFITSIFEVRFVLCSKYMFRIYDMQGDECDPS
jgi:hypothetical protein